MNLKRLSSYMALCMAAVLPCMADHTDSIHAGFRLPLSWKIGLDANPSWVPGSNSFLKGNNNESKKIQSGVSGDIHVDFSFSPATREGMLYSRLYQGAGIGVNSFFSNSILGTPISAYIYQGAPIVSLSNDLWLGYEWRFGAAFGWKHYDEETAGNNVAVSTSVTAILGIGVKIHYALSDRWQLAFGINATHYSNGNTTWPNGGINAIGTSVGIACILNPSPQQASMPSWLEAEADKARWLYDIVAYGAWRKKAVNTGGEYQICPGHFGIAGLLFSPLRKLNRWVAVGPSLDLQWNESAALESYWIEGTTGNDIKFERPPFMKQISAGISAHAELTMPIFSVNAGIGYDFVNHEGEKRFYQSLTLKTFLTGNIFLNVGYRLGNFKDPQNLMLGVGVRL